MSVRFIFGRAGSGKTRRLFDAAVGEAAADPLGAPIYWLLPRQATFQTERRLAVDSGLPGLCRVLVLSFDQFGEIIREQCGGIAIPQINAYGRQMILGHLLRTHENDLRFFRAVARQPGLAAELDAAFSEFERIGRSASDLEAAIGIAPDPFDPYSAKLHDLTLLYRQYEKYLGDERIDPHRRLTQVVGCIEQWSELRGARVFVDGFFDFAAAERQLLLAMARGGADMTIAMLLDPDSAEADAGLDAAADQDGMNVFHRCRAAYRSLRRVFVEADIDIEPPLRLNAAAIGFSEPLRTIERTFFSSSEGATPTRDGPDSTSDSDADSDAAGICLIEAPDRQSEVDAVARHVRSLLAEGMRLRDIAVLARDLTPYADLIESSFAAHGLRCFIDRRRSASHHPLIRFVRLLPLLAENRWPNEAVLGLCKSGLMGLSPSQADELERYVLDHRIDGVGWIQPEPWTFGVRSSTSQNTDAPGAEPQGLALALRVDAMRKAIVEKLRPWSAAIAGPAALASIVDAMTSLFDRCAISATLDEWMSRARTDGLPDEAIEHESVWDELRGLLEQMRALLAEETVSPGEFAGILQTGLERFDLGVTPPTVDELLVGTIDRTRTPALKAVVLIGWNDGSFPRRPGISPVLSDNDRDQLGVGGDSTRKLLDERLLAYYALTRASQRLCVTRPTADDAGKKLPPSAYWLRLTEMFPTLMPMKVARNDLSTLATPRQLTTTLMKWVDSLSAADASSVAAEPDAAAGDSGGPMPSLYQWLMSRPAGSRFAIVRDQAWAALAYRNGAALTDAHAAALFQSPLRMSVRSLESFAACPFQHFADSVLRLRRETKPTIGGGDLSRLYGDVLGRVIRDMIRAKRDWDGPSPRARPTIRKHADAIAQTLRDELMMSTARNRFMLERAQNELELVVATQELVASRSDYKPAIVGAYFGDSRSPIGGGLGGAVAGDNDRGKLPPLSVKSPAGRTVDLTGRIDRIDLAPAEDGGVSASVIDYELGGGSLPLDRVYHGLSLQLLTYLLVLQASGQSLHGRPLTPAAAFYVKMLRGLEAVAHPADAKQRDDSEFLLKDKMRGVVDASCIAGFDRDWIEGRSDIINATLKNNGELGYRDQSDFALPTEFAALLQLVRHRIGELIDQLCEGDIDVKPFRIGDDSPCARCSFRSVCRFDKAVDRYRFFPKMKRSEVLDAITVGGGS